MQAADSALLCEPQYWKGQMTEKSGKDIDLKGLVFEVHVANVEHVSLSMKMANLIQAWQYLKVFDSIFPTFREHIMKLIYLMYPFYCICTLERNYKFFQSCFLPLLASANSQPF